MPTKEFIYETWAPPGGLWSGWTKPVLFARMDYPPPETMTPEIPEPPEWLPPAAERAALVLDLPAEVGVKLGLAAARLGYRPVPLYNAVPFPTIPQYEALLYYREMRFSAAMVNVLPIMVALWNGTQELDKMQIPADAPPAFLLDADRGAGCMEPYPGQFDNRSISFTTDFPSANFLRAHNISRAVLVQNSGDKPQVDLSHTLRRWQEGGLPILLKRLDQTGPPVPCAIERPSQFGLFCQRVLAAFRLRRNTLGGFGGMVPDPNEEGGWAGG